MNKYENGFGVKILILSIIMPVYNSEQYLVNAVESVLAQTFEDYELIIVDDGSSDGSTELCDTLAKKDGRIVVIHQENRGIGGARNTGLKVANGKYIGFMDNDDLIHPQMFEILVSIAEKEQADIVMFPPKLVDVGWVIPASTYTISEIKCHGIDKKLLFERLFSRSNDDFIYVTVWNKLWKRSILEKDMFPLYGSEDCVFNCKAYGNAGKTILMDIQPDLYYWVQRNDSTSHNGFTNYHCMCLQSYFDMERYVFESMPEYHYLVLEKTYRKILSFRYNSKGTKFEKKVEQIISENIKAFQSRFARQKEVGTLKKVFYGVFFYSPVTYGVFRIINEIVARIRKNRKNK